MKAGHIPEAIDEFRAAMRVTPDFVQAYANLAQALASAEKLDESAATARKGIEIARATRQEAAAGQLQQWLTSLPVESNRNGDAPAAPESIRPTANP